MSFNDNVQLDPSQVQDRRGMGRSSAVDCRDLFDRRVRLNITAFRMDVSGLQTPSALGIVFWPAC